MENTVDQLRAAFAFGNQISILYITLVDKIVLASGSIYWNSWFLLKYRIKIGLAFEFALFLEFSAAWIIRFVTLLAPLGCLGLVDHLSWSEDDVRNVE